MFIGIAAYILNRAGWLGQGVTHKNRTWRRESILGPVVSNCVHSAQRLFERPYGHINTLNGSVAEIKTGEGAASVM